MGIYLETLCRVYSTLAKVMKWQGHTAGEMPQRQRAMLPKVHSPVSDRWKIITLLNTREERFSVP